jgi:hypothetical protein
MRPKLYRLIKWQEDILVYGTIFNLGTRQGCAANLIRPFYAGSHWTEGQVVIRTGLEAVAKRKTSIPDSPAV